jgi:hypothetical protein
MNKQRTSYAPVVVAVFLMLLPLLYVGSYFALVTPGEYTTHYTFIAPMYVPKNYRRYADTAGRVFWPLEQVDRKARPEAWELEVPSPIRIPIFLCPSHPPDENRPNIGNGEERAG